MPWLIHAAGASNRAPRRSEREAARPYLSPLLDRLPRLAVVVLAGRIAGDTRSTLADLRPDLPVFGVPHPSPTYVCASPSVSERILASLREAQAILAASSTVQRGAAGTAP